MIDWSLTAEEIERRVRGLAPWPGAFTPFRGKRLHVWRAEVVAVAEGRNAAPGTISTEGKRLAVACGEGTQLLLHEVQLEGRKRLSAREFMNGAHVESGETLGS